MTDRLTNTLKLASENTEAYLAILEGLLKIPSVSSKEENYPDVQKAAEYVSNQLTEIGMTRVEIFETALHPIVYAENLDAGKDAPTVLLYGHYDVQAAEPLEDWNTKPFEPTRIGENLYARGTTDNKGEVIMCMSVVDAIMQTGPLPINIKFLIEGEEEVGVENLYKFIQENSKLLACDFSLNTDGGMADFDQPSIIYGLRGGTRITLEVLGPKQAIHSGLFGGVVQNPIQVLSKLIAKIHDENGTIMIPGFYDDVEDVTEKERELLAKNPKNEASYLRESGAPKLWGEKEFTHYERTVIRPTCDILMIEGGEAKSAITESAKAIISFRLVPHQDPDRILELIKKFIEENLPDTVRWVFTLVTKAPAIVINLDSDYMKLMGDALKTVWGKDPVFERIGGSIPAIGMLKAFVGIDTVLTGISLPDDNLHGPNEKIHIPSWEKGIQTLIHFFFSLAK